MGESQMLTRGDSVCPYDLGPSPLMTPLLLLCPELLDSSVSLREAVMVLYPLKPRFESTCPTDSWELRADCLPLCASFATPVKWD